MAVSLLEKVARYGIKASAGKGYNKVKGLVLEPYYRHKHRRAPSYSNPSDGELEQIEEGLHSHGNTLKTLTISREDFQEFKDRLPFPSYYFSHDAVLRNEKLLEHFIAYEMCNLQDAVSASASANAKDFLYLDVAGSGSPWVQVLNDNGINAVSIDLQPSASFRHLEFYRKMDATKTDFEPASVDGISLQCAYEMFIGDNDRLLVDECVRILKPGGSVVIVPLYMHTHYCGYSTLEYYGKGFADPGATEYIRLGIPGVPFSRKYDVEKLNERVISRAEQQGMTCVLYALQDKDSLGEGVYCHFVLKMTKALDT